MIDFGIDLGTTNSAIARFRAGKATVFSHPLSGKQTLPSVVAFREGSILVGEKAREYLAVDPGQVYAGFKRKMGTDERFRLPFPGRELSPEDLSAEVLKELKQFLPTGELPEAAVITIPAAFGTAQANATLEAGRQAGFHHIELLQEPIAASLAYANAGHTKLPETGSWLVYDLGGGTFDVALLEIVEGEIRVRDHEGDNFLGGTDIDQALIDRLVIPYLEATGRFRQMERKLKRASGSYHPLYQLLRFKAEAAKIALSSAEETELEFDTADEAGTAFQGLVRITRAQLQDLLDPLIDDTLKLVSRIIERQQLQTGELHTVLMVGGSTRIPYLRERVATHLGVPVDTSVDPETAVALGAAYYAGTRPQPGPKQSTASPQKAAIRVKTAYQKVSQDSTELFTARVEGEIEALFYRITRLDGGFDSGRKPLQRRIEEELPLQPDSFNRFQLLFFDRYNQPLGIEVPEIGISQGGYGVIGQPLPQDICLEVDDPDNQRTALEVIFPRNALLPTKRTLTKQITRTIPRGANDQVIINVLEGPGDALPAANQPIGYISISGKELQRDLLKGSDVEITLEMSASRELRINAYLLMTDQEFENVFIPEWQSVSLHRLAADLKHMVREVKSEVETAEEQGNYTTARELIDMEFSLLEMTDRVAAMDEDDRTDEKYQLEARKRKLAQRIDQLTRDKHINQTRQRYFRAKRHMEHVMHTYQAPAADRAAYEDILSQEKEFLASNNPLIIQSAIDRINQLNARIMWKSPQYLIEVFTDLAEERYGRFTRPEQARALVHNGQQAISQGNYQELRACIGALWALLPPQARQSTDFDFGTGIG